MFFVQRLQARLENAQAFRTLAARAFFFGVAYLLGAILSTRLSFSHGNALAFWPPVGLILGVLLITPRREWPAYWGAGCVMNEAYHYIHAHSPFLEGALLNTTDFLAAAGAVALMRVLKCGVPSLSKPRDVFFLTLTSGAVACVTSSCGMGDLWVFGQRQVALRLWPLWWSGDGIGLLLFTPLVLAWVGPGSRDPEERRFTPEAAFFLVTAAAAAVLAFGSAELLPMLQTHPYMTFPVLLWGAMRLRSPYLTLGMVALALTAACATADADFIRAHGAVHIQDLRHLQSYLCVGQLCALLPAAVVAQRRVAEEAIKSLNETLERRVLSRTAELEESRTRYRDLTTISPVGIFGSDAQKKITYVNEKWCAMTGMEVEQARGDGWLAAVHPEDRDRVWAGWMGRTEAGEKETTDFRFLRPDGQVIWVMAQFVPRIEDGVLSGFFGSITDITERKRSELLLQEGRERLEERIRERTAELSQRNEELKCQILEREKIARELVESESALRTFFESAPVMMGIVEVRGDDICFISMNTASAALGGEYGAAPGRTALELGWAPHEVAPWITGCRESKQQRQPQRLRQRRLVGGEEREFAVTVAALGSIGSEARYCYVAEDVTDVARAQQAQERFKSILEATTDMVGMADRFGRLFYINTAGREMLGLEPDQPLDGMRLPDVHVAWAFDLVAREGLPIAILEGAWRGETAVLAKDGTELPASELILAHKSPSGSLEFLSTIIRDMSEQKEAEEKVKNSLEEKEVLLKEIHHRVKNNMQIVSSLLQLQSTYIKDPDALRIFEESRDRIKSMALIHEQLYQSNDLAKIDFPEYLRSLLNMVFSANRTDRTRVESRLRVDPVSLDLDTAIPVGLIANELVTNSLKYAFAGRTDGEIVVQLTKSESEEYTLAVSDNGVGLPKDFAFERTNSLGLRLVRILTKQMRGRLEVVNGTGTEFRIHFKAQGSA